MKYIAIHHTAVAGSTPQLYAVNRYHKDKWGMKSSRGWYVGYNYFIDTDGTQTLTRAIGEETVAVKGHNCDHPSRCDTISVCLAGDFNIDFPTEKQDTKVRQLITQLKEIYPDIQVTGHRDLQTNRTCPGKNISKGYFETEPTPEPPEDADKKKIADMQRTLDSLRAILRNLLSQLNSK